MAAQALHCCVWAFTSCSEWRLLSSCSARASHCSGFSCCRARAPEHEGISSCSLWARMCAQWLWHMGSDAPQHVESSWIRDWIHVPCINRWIPNHRTTREVLVIHFNYSGMFMLIANSLTILSPHPSPLVTLSLFSVYSGILLSHEKEWNNAICSNMDGPGECHTKWDQSDRERKISSDTSYMRNLKRNHTNELICKTETVDPHWLSQTQRLNICFENLVRRHSLKWWVLCLHR